MSSTVNLIDYGYNPKYVSEDTTPLLDGNDACDTDQTDKIIARILAVHKDRYIVVCRYGETGARLKTSTYMVKQEEEYPTTGDFVVVHYVSNGDSVITKTLPRKSCFTRLDPSSRGNGEQVVAANFDYVFIMCSLNGNFNLKRIERYITLAWQSGGIPVVILTKSDLVDNPENQIREVERIAIGVAVFAISSKTGKGIEQLNEYLKAGKTIVFLGSSGVGKSSLVNTLAGDKIMNVNSIREDDSRGRHTTTHRQLLKLKNGVMIIDTPGMRELGMWDVSDGLCQSFADVEQFLGKCQFSNCKHETEPGCAIKEAIEQGKLSKERWESYLSLQKEAKYSENKTQYITKKTNWHKSIQKTIKNSKKIIY